MGDVTGISDFGCSISELLFELNVWKRYYLILINIVFIIAPLKSTI
ncbi:hypothetical protein MgSA37_04282 [Mucilaginibacter gotjawali]|uniref:Uncharacterized protein n=2 Tax=Mucilaginibacter gotjawali TaxID=1550579 RepID=A0A0X8X5J6_9SPHI|nr:hypothetical protein [Mucilaginibacter gotjawali]BAU56085.1 hypothetical protein MgSA37_04282 [Mucilaginibacter gotjawali]